MEREQYLSSTSAFFPDVFLDYSFSSIKALLKYLLSENFKHPTTLLALLIPFILLYLLIPVVCVSFQHDLYFTSLILISPYWNGSFLNSEIFVHVSGQAESRIVPCAQ